ncbi:MAG: DUF455 family protein [Alphaproteobacteria bacterium]|nr:DUF455 family protein [Alphaproteobacteria bacterium]
MKSASVYRAARKVLETADPEAKARAAEEAADLSSALDGFDGWPAPPDRPARPPRPVLVSPGKVKRRRLGTAAGRAALLHALAHIELNAIDLAADMAVRFSPAVHLEGLDGGVFCADWLRIAAEEARHFNMLCNRLAKLDAAYGDFPAHDGLWSAAVATADDVLARLAIAPLVLEARGLDVTPSLIDKLRKAGDEESAAALEIIYRDEIGHVSAGAAWFRAIARRRGLNPEATFAGLVAARFAGGLKPPFNEVARRKAGLDPDFYRLAKAGPQ